MSAKMNLFLTQKRLVEWGVWCEQIVSMRLSYSHQSLIARIQDGGGMLISSTAKILAPKNERAEEVNTLIEYLAASPPKGMGKPAWAKVIRIHYTMRERDNKLKIHASALNPRTYYRYLRAGEAWLSAYLE